MGWFSTKAGGDPGRCRQRDFNGNPKTRNPKNIVGVYLGYTYLCPYIPNLFPLYSDYILRVPGLGLPRNPKP